MNGNNTSIQKINSYSILKKIIQFIDTHDCKDVAIVTDDLGTLKALDFLLYQKNILLNYKKFFIDNQISIFLLNSIEAMIYDFSVPYLLKIFKNPIISKTYETEINQIEKQIFRDINPINDLKSIKKKINGLCDSSLIDKLDAYNKTLNDSTNSYISQYIIDSLNYLISVIGFAEPIDLFFESLHKIIDYKIESIEKYYDLLYYLMQNFCYNSADDKKDFNTNTLNQDIKNLFAFKYSEILLIQEQNIILINEEIFNNCDFLSKTLPEKNIICIKEDLFEYNYDKRDILIKNSYNPPIDARPKILNTAMINHLISDPYQFYVKYILKIKKLQPINKIPGKSEFNLLLHKILIELSICNHVKESQMIQHISSVLSKHYKSYAYIEKLWSKKIHLIINHFVDFHNARIVNLSNLEAKKTFHVTFSGITIYSQIDRVEYANDKIINVIDYNTNKNITLNNIINYKSPQLLVKGLIANLGLELKINELFYCSISEEDLSILQIPNQDDEIMKFSEFLSDIFDKYIHHRTPFTSC